jgi:hypothetical protein
MNNANAAAKARRAGIKPTTPVPTAAAPASQGSSGLTLPQVISVIDRRLVTLEAFMKETKENPAPMMMQQGDEGEGQVEGEESAGIIVPAEFNAFVDEINNRFQMLASEIETMKNAMLKLQTFTMDVNKSLLEKTEVLVPASVTEAVVPLPEVTLTDPVSVADESVTEDAPVEEPSA